MMPGAGPPPVSFFLYSFGLSLIVWGFFLAVFIVMGRGIPVQGKVIKGLYFGVVVFLVGSLGQNLGLGLLVNLPYGLLFVWTLESLVIDLANGALAGRLEA